MRKLFNISNHPSSGWSEEQKRGWDVIIDIPFPNTPPELSGEEVKKMVQEFLKVSPEPMPGDYVFVAGDFSATYYMTSILQEKGVIFTWPSTQRETTETIQPDGSVKKTAVYRFVRWR